MRCGYSRTCRPQVRIAPASARGHGAAKSVWYLRTTHRVRSGRRQADRRTSPAHQNGRSADAQLLPAERAEYLRPGAGGHPYRDVIRASRARSHMLGRSGFPMRDPLCPGVYRPSLAPISKFARLHNHRPRVRRIGDRAYSCRPLSSLDLLPSANSMRRNGMFR